MLCLYKVSFESYFTFMSMWKISQTVTIIDWGQKPKTEDEEVVFKEKIKDFLFHATIGLNSWLKSNEKMQWQKSKPFAREDSNF